MQVKVIKSDTSVENYIYTKVLGTILNSLNADDIQDLETAQELCNAITYFIYHKRDKQLIKSSEIFSMVLTVLSQTGFTKSANYLEQHYYTRKLKRNRIQVVDIEVDSPLKAALARKIYETGQTSSWDKSKVVRWLNEKYAIEIQTARTVAACVEDKIISFNTTIVTTGLIRQISSTETACFMEAADCLACRNHIAALDTRTPQTNQQWILPELLLA